jgi:hypothetical protein
LVKNQDKPKGKHGGWRPGGGRPKGSRPKVTAEIRDLAQVYTADALKTLASIMQRGESEAARVAAANSLLDRGYGKPAQALQHTGGDGGPVAVTWLPPQ